MLQNVLQFVNQHPVLSLAWVGLFIVVIVASFQSHFSKIKVITRDEATRLINQEDAVVVDIRAETDYGKGHITQAINLAPIDIKNNKLNVLEKYKKKPIIVVCLHGTASRVAAETINKAGFERVFTLKEGISGWDKENLPLARGK